MRRTSSLTLYLLVILISLAIFQTSSRRHRFLADSDNDQASSTNSQESAEDVSKDYRLIKQWKSDDNYYHYVLEYQGIHNKYANSVSMLVKKLDMIVSFHDDKTFRVKIIDFDNARWEIPERSPFPHFASQETISMEDGCCNIQVQEIPFSFTITRKDTAQVIFDTKDKLFVYSDLYIELSTSLPTSNVYGFGERNFRFQLSSGTYTIWGRDDPKILEDGRGGSNTYSHQPIGLMRDLRGDFFLTLMRNSNAMDVIISGPKLTYKMVGGVIDLVFFVGDKYPETVIKAYHNYIGNFTMMPFWSMGYHQSKWGYTTHATLLDVVNHYNQYNVPLDVIWSDIDYMIDKEIFTIDENNYPVEQMRELSTKYKKRWVPIIDPGVKQLNTRGPGASTGLERDIFLKSFNGHDLVGSVWPGRVYFPDFFNPNTIQYWSDMLDVLYQKVPFSGIWLDMNEVANFVDREDGKRFSLHLFK